MIHIKPDRCGYNGYACEGLRELKQPYIGYPFTHTKYSGLEEPVLWSTRADASDSDNGYNRFGMYGGMEYGGYETSVASDYERTLIAATGNLVDGDPTIENIDNYYNIPISIRGIVMSVNYIPDMDTMPGGYVDESDSDSSIYRALLPPEAACEEDNEVSDSFSPFMRVYSDVAKVAVNFESPLLPPPGPQSLANAYHPVTDAVGYSRHALPGFPTQEHVMDPGILDVMLNNPFDPVDIDLGPAIGFDIDGLLLSIYGINKWRIRITRLINYYISLFNSLANAQEEACEDITIKSSGAYYTSSSSRHFDVRASNITVNGAVLSTVTGGFDVNKTNPVVNVYIKLAFHRDGPLQSYLEVTPSVVTSASGPGTQSVYISIGGVRQTKLGNSKYLYQITQDRCHIDVDLVRTSGGGIVVRGGFGGKTAGGSGSPFGIAEIGTCDEEE